jgi:hypothetical protein
VGKTSKRVGVRRPKKIWRVRKSRKRKNSNHLKNWKRKDDRGVQNLKIDWW